MQFVTVVPLFDWHLSVAAPNYLCQFKRSFFEADCGFVGIGLSTFVGCATLDQQSFANGVPETEGTSPMVPTSGVVTLFGISSGIPWIGERMRCHPLPCLWNRTVGRLLCSCLVKFNFSWNFLTLVRRVANSFSRSFHSSISFSSTVSSSLFFCHFRCFFSEGLAFLFGEMEDPLVLLAIDGSLELVSTEASWLWSVASTYCLLFVLYCLTRRALGQTH